MALKNNLLKTFQAVTARPKSGEKQNAGKTLAVNAAKGAAGRAAGAAAAPFAKWIAIGVIVALLLVLLGGLGNGGLNVAKNAAPLSECQYSADKNEIITGLEGSGETLTADEKKEIMDMDQAGSCKKSGVGFNGEAYPPTAGKITTFFGIVDDLHPRGHAGMDIASSCGAPIFAFSGGTVTAVTLGTEEKSGEGGYVYPMGQITIQHTEEFSTRYLHMNGASTTVKVGDVVSAGMQIATQWSNGPSTGCHLHIEARINGELKDMNDYLKACGFEYSDTAVFNAFPAAPVQCGGGGVAPGAGSGGDIKNYAKTQMQGINGVSSSSVESEFQCLNSLWIRESNWNPTAINPQFDPSSAAIPENQAYGIAQAAPGGKMISEGADWKTNPETQVRWGLKYIAGRYGTPCGAWAHSEANNWY